MFRQAPISIAPAILLVCLCLPGCQQNAAVPDETGIAQSAADAQIVTGDRGTLVQIPKGGLNRKVDFAVHTPSNEEIRTAIPANRPYAGAVTITASMPKDGEAGDPANEGFRMAVTSSLNRPLPAGTVLDVYCKGEDYGEWARLDAKATVRADGVTAAFKVAEPGTYLLRERDEHSTTRVDLDGIAKAVDGYVPEVGYGLHKIAGTGAIPIVLIHGAGSNVHTAPGIGECGYEDCGQYARWDEFVAWAVGGGLDLGKTYQLWWFLHDPLDAVGFFEEVEPPALENNVWQFAQELEAKRAMLFNPFPGEDQQFIIVAHSRGGLVARAFMENWPSGGDQVLAALTLATPHHGSCLGAPDWVLDTVDHRYWGAPVQLVVALAWEQGFYWDKPGSADLAWDNFDGTAPYAYGLPYREFSISALFSNLMPVSGTVSTNDAGWPTDSAIEDPTLRLPPEYILDDNVTPGRRGGTTLWDLNHRSHADRYLDKFILYGGYMYKRGGWIDAIAGALGDPHRGLAYVNQVMSNFQSANTSLFLYAANDGFVALQSALYLNGSDEEPIYAMKDQWFGGKKVRYPIELDEERITARLKLRNADHMMLWPDYDHLSMVAGKDGDSALFESIAERLDWTVASRPTAAFTVEPVNSGTTVTLDTSGSHDNPTDFWPATDLEYRVAWDASDGLAWSDWGPSPANHAYAANGTYTISLQVRDQDGMTSDVAVTGVTVEDERR